MSFESCVSSLKDAIINHCSGLISTHNTDSTAHSNILSNWSTVYNKSGLVIQENSSIGLIRAEFFLGYNFTESTLVNHITDIPSAYCPEVTITTMGNPSTNAVTLAITGSGILQFRRTTGTGSLNVSGEFVYMKKPSQ